MKPSCSPLQSSSALWSATEMKYRKQMLAMRKRNMELLEKLKEVRPSPLLPPSTNPTHRIPASTQ